jgi:hypothetical protein
VDEAVLEVVQLVNVLHNFLTLGLYKVLDKRISANGNPKANVAVHYEGLGGEQGDWCVCLLLQYLLQSCSCVGGGGHLMEDMCYEGLRAEVDYWTAVDISGDP